MKRLAGPALILAMLLAFVGCRFAADWATGPASQPEEAPAVSEHTSGANTKPPGSQPLSGKLTVHVGLLRLEFGLQTAFLLTGGLRP